MSDINRIRILSGMPPLPNTTVINEALEGSHLQALKNAAQKNSETGPAQYVNKDDTCTAGYCLSDHYDAETTVCGYKDGEMIPGISMDLDEGSADYLTQLKSAARQNSRNNQEQYISRDPTSRNGYRLNDTQDAKTIYCFKNGQQVQCSVGMQESAPPGMEDLVMKLKKEYPGHEEKAFQTAWSIYNKKHGKKTEEVEESLPDFLGMMSKYQSYKELGKKDPSMKLIADKLEKELRSHGLLDRAVEEETTFMDGEIEEARGKKEAITAPFHAEEINALVPLSYEEAKPAALELINNSSTSPEKKEFLVRQIENNRKGVQGIVALLYNMLMSFEGLGVVGSKYGKRFESIAEALNNGYDDRHEADEFGEYPGFAIPTGADGSVVKKTGPSGARQGDNPEQKKMAVTEDIYKEMVYKYRTHIAEATSINLKDKLSGSPHKALELQLDDVLGTIERSGDTLSYQGTIDVSGHGLSVNGDRVALAYCVNVGAFADITWEDDELPIDANSYSGAISYKDASIANISDVVVTDISFNEDDEVVIVDGEEVSTEDGYRTLLDVLHRDTVKQMLDPSTYADMLQPKFEDAASEEDRENY